MRAVDILGTQSCGRNGCDCAASLKRGHGLTHCVVHKPDEHPSLSVSEKNGTVLVNCKANKGCQQGEVWMALRRMFPSREEAVPVARRKEVAKYNYEDASGKLIYQVLRYDPKGFSQRAPTEAGGWVHSLNGVPRVLYHLPELHFAIASSDPIYVTEGEKDADAINAAGHFATTNPGGAGNWRPEFAKDLQGCAQIIIVQDKDQAGYDHAVDVAKSLDEAVPPIPYRVVEAKTGKDAFDHLSAGWKVDDFVPAQRFKSAPTASTLPWRTARQIATETPEKVDWLVPGYIARGAITDWSAKVKTGKSSLMLVMARSIATGSPFLDLPTTASPVVILTEERPASFRNALARWDLLGLDNVHVLYRKDARGIDWPDIISLATQKCLEAGAHLLCIDTFSDWAQLGESQENDSGASAAAMLPIQAAAEQDIAVLLSRHDRKSGGEIGESARGSSAIAGMADILIQIRRAESPGHERRRLISAVGRFDATPNPLLIDLTDDYHFIPLGDSLDLERAQAKTRILDLCPDVPPGLSIPDLLASSPGIARTTLQRAAKDLVQARLLIARPGLGPNKRTVGFFRPPNSLPTFDLDA